MSQGTACHVREHREQGRWVVLQRHCNRSAFNGWRETWSHYSEIRCLECGAIWRTRAPYVELLKDATIEERLQP